MSLLQKVSFSVCQQTQVIKRKMTILVQLQFESFEYNGLFMHIECEFSEMFFLKNKYLVEIIAYKKIKAFSPMQKTYNIGSIKFSFPFNIELLFHYVVLKCLLQGSQMQLFCIFLNFLPLELNSGHATFLHYVTSKKSETYV